MSRSKRNKASRTAEIPTFSAGGYVYETGIALVHEGEYIRPASGSEAVIGSTDGTGPETINYHFPVRIEIVGELSEEEREAIQERVFRRLLEALDSLG